MNTPETYSHIFLEDQIYNNMREALLHASEIRTD